MCTIGERSYYGAAILDIELTTDNGRSATEEPPDRLLSIAYHLRVVGQPAKRAHELPIGLGQLGLRQ
jgi:hypothetical protein